jgi:hypothetical protein
MTAESAFEAGPSIKAYSELLYLLTWVKLINSDRKTRTTTSEPSTPCAPYRNVYHSFPPLYRTSKAIHGSPRDAGIKWRGEREVNGRCWSGQREGEWRDDTQRLCRCVVHGPLCEVQQSPRGGDVRAYRLQRIQKSGRVRLLGRLL